MPDHRHAGPIIRLRRPRALGLFDPFFQDDTGSASIDFVALSAGALVLGIIVFSSLAQFFHGPTASIESLIGGQHSGSKTATDAFAGTHGSAGAGSPSGNGEATEGQPAAAIPGANPFMLMHRAETRKDRF